MNRHFSDPSYKWIGFVFMALVLFCPEMRARTISVLMLPQVAAPPAAQPSPTVVALKMRVVDGKVNAEITAVPLQTVLQELAERSGIIFEIRTQENPAVTLRLNQVPLEQAIKRIASGCSMMFSYGQAAGQPERITMVKIFPRGTPVQQPAIAYLGTGTVTRSNDVIETPEDALKALAERKDLEGKQKAVEILIASKSEMAAQALVGAIADPAPEIRVAAIEGLVTLQVHNALPEILKCLKDGYPRVRQSAATAVALLGDAKNIKDIRPLRSDRDSSVAAAAETAIRRLSTAASKK